MGYYKDLDIKRQEEEFEREAHEFAADCSDENWQIELEAEAEIARTEPLVGSWAETARMMANMFPDDGVDWDAWKDEMKESDL